MIRIAGSGARGEGGTRASTRTGLPEGSGRLPSSLPSFHWRLGHSLSPPPGLPRSSPAVPTRPPHPPTRRGSAPGAAPGAGGGAAPATRAAAAGPARLGTARRGAAAPPPPQVRAAATGASSRGGPRRRAAAFPAESEGEGGRAAGASPPSGSRCGAGTAQRLASPRLTSPHLTVPAGPQKLLPPSSLPSVGVVPGLRGTAAGGRAGGRGRWQEVPRPPRSPSGTGVGCGAGGCPAGTGWRDGCFAALKCAVKGRPSGATGRRR